MYFSTEKRYLNEFACCLHKLHIVFYFGTINHLLAGEKKCKNSKLLFSIETSLLLHLRPLTKDLNWIIKL